MKIVVTGGAGYLGSVLSLALLECGHEVRIVDNLMYGGHGLLPLVGHPRFRFRRTDIRDSRAVASALDGADAIVHLAAIVGDPACARVPDVACAVNYDASGQLLAAAQDAGIQRFVFASTCSNYGRMADPSVFATEADALRPLSLYAETKVAVERLLLQLPLPMVSTVLRFATLYGVSPRMRFDLTVNQFVRETHQRRKLTVYGEQFWRPYVHVRDAARAIVAVLAAPAGLVAGEVFNVGDTDENYRKLDLIDVIRQEFRDPDVEFVSVIEDPRDYRVSFDHIRTVLNYQTTRKVRDGVAEIAGALDWRTFDSAAGMTANVAERPHVISNGSAAVTTCAP